MGNSVAGFDLSGEQVAGARARIKLFAEMEVSLPCYNNCELTFDVIPIVS